MAAKSEKSPWLRTAIAGLAGVILYFAAYFPAMSYAARHPEARGLIRIWSPVLSFASDPMWTSWSKIDPDGEQLWSDYVFSHLPP